MASREVFVDTSAVYALIDRRDAAYAAARDTVGTPVRSGRKVVVTDYVVAETVNLANVRGGSIVGRRVLDLVEQSAGIRLEWLGIARFELSKAFFRKHADRHYSFTDCTSCVIMRELRISEAHTTDRHFPEAGFRNLLPV